MLLIISEYICTVELISFSNVSVLLSTIVLLVISVTFSSLVNNHLTLSMATGGNALITKNLNTVLFPSTPITGELSGTTTGGTKIIRNKYG